MNIVLTLADWWSLFLHFVSLSLLAVGGAITTAPDIHRYLVDETHWLSDTQFTSSIALAQGAPGPNVMFVALMGWNVGLNAAGGLAAGWHAVGLALWGVLITMVGILIPSCTLTFVATQWAHRNRELRAVKAFKAGMAPIVIALLIATGWLLTGDHDNPARDWPLWTLTAITTLIVWKTKTHLLVLLGVGALLGAMGWI
ncbi:chromate transporter [Limnohabitans sp. B9-3]|uniref:chromate transporter n=1 Tax=Limnohabitans sp. B9-3 TaxID=1100707 RepID=UPI000C1E936B|nr:chromate transporter [Limnohabitans sp. B9-3]PIT77785.1 chromate transporter [Limnohabitans sp. B9-3]